MPSISFLGTGSGLPSAERFFSSAILSVDGRNLLIDAGEPCVHLLRDRGDVLQEIDAILLTHGHVDHVGGLPALLQGAMLLERTKPLTIYLPGEMVSPFRDWIRALYLTEEGLGFPLRWVAWIDQETVILGDDLSVTPYANTHLQSCYRTLPGADLSRSCDSYSLEICHGAGRNFRAVFSGDLSSPDELKPLLADPLSVLVCELSHFSMSELAQVLKDASVGSLCLVHLSEDLAEDREYLQGKLEELLPKIGDIIIPGDGEHLDF